jgi:hypothetical protein
MSSRVDRRRERLLSEVATLARSAGGWCVASNEYLSERLKIPLRTLERDFSTLVKNQRLEVQTTWGAKNTNPAYTVGSYFRQRKSRPVLKVEAQPLPPGAEVTAEGVVLEPDWRKDKTLRCISGSKPVELTSVESQTDALLQELARKEAEREALAALWDEQLKNS